MSERYEKKHSLDAEFTDIIKSVDVESEVITEHATHTRQYKYYINDASEYKKLLLKAGAIQTSPRPIEQMDYYFLYPGEKPGLKTSTLCWREQKEFNDYTQQDPQEPSAECQLIVKSDAEDASANPSFHVRYANIKDPDTQLAVLEKINMIRHGNDLVPYRVSKKRTTYSLPIEGGESVEISLDEQVELSDQSTDFSPHLMGDFLKIKVPKDSASLIHYLKELLNVTGDNFDVPYIAKEAFVKLLYTSRPNTLSAGTHDSERLWIRSQHKPYYYDALKDEFITGIDPTKLKGFDGNHRKQIQEEIEAICADLDSSNGGQELASRSSGGGGGSTTYEKLTGHNGFSNYPSIRANLTSATLWRKRWQPSERRIVFSRLTLNNEQSSQGVFVHYIGDHDGYERWLRLHRDS